jgi:hypothetical protein
MLPGVDFLGSSQQSHVLHPFSVYPVRGIPVSTSNKIRKSVIADKRHARYTKLVGKRGGDVRFEVLIGHLDTPTDI